MAPNSLERRMNGVAGKALKRQQERFNKHLANLEKQHKEEVTKLVMANKYYVQKLDALPKWFKWLYPNSWH